MITDSDWLVRDSFKKMVDGITFVTFSSSDVLSNNASQSNGAFSRGVKGPELARIKVAKTKMKFKKRTISEME